MAQLKMEVLNGESYSWHTFHSNWMILFAMFLHIFISSTTSNLISFSLHLDQASSLSLATMVTT